jgi:hypothetical protein
MKTALVKKRPAAIYSGSVLEMARMMPVRIGAVMPASLDRAEAMPVAVPLLAIGKRRGVYPSRLGTLNDNDSQSAGQGHSQIIAYISVPWNEIQTLAIIVPDCDVTKTKKRMPTAVARVDKAMASFLPMRVSR